ncbi:LuxR family transcriptional regulator [Rhizobium rhizosphaerae]|uniref:LuxR family transcriptional regulator n=1 Tax=Xaviernesmea rhizosphaerae TaxID=1672749 RepID=A0ABX3PC69_9HYPH|nr:LuxR family transcriptional regulator [Xaviernesmea rhizosphaerae]OQP86064.1 LuxR family transcriptional regulator [Xaviernesmea rhizosphaerae]
MASEVAQLRTQFDVIRFMKRKAQAFGFRYFMIARVPTVEMETLAGASIVSNVPVELTAHYDKAGLLHSSGGMKRLRETATPFQFDLDDWYRQSVPSEELAQHMKILAAHQIEQSNYFPVHYADGSRGVVIFLGARHSFSMAELMELQMISIHVYNRLAEIGVVLRDNGLELTEREIECLNWTAAGKTSAEIASIIGLSEHTVNHYLNHVTRKLGAVNRTQAVVKAIRLGYVR